MEPRHSLERLLAFNCEVLDQALHLIDRYLSRPSLNFAEQTGPHLRHVIEHYRAFIDQVADRSVDYDARARDAGMERDPVRARAQVLRLQEELRKDRAALATDPIAVHQRGGLCGEENFVSFSTVERELLFLSSHATHHYALIRQHCLIHGIDTGANFGKAPSTIRHEQHCKS